MDNEKSLIGRPKLYNTAKEMQEKIDQYFLSCFHPLFDKRGNPVINPVTGEYILEQYRPFTMSGLANALDMSRQSLINYSKDEDFFDTIERARRKVEVYTEEKLFEKETCNGSKFSLSNNFGWAEKKEIEHHVEKLEDVLDEIL